MSKVVLITGCSSGIGRDLAQRLAHSGYTVVATARKVESLEDLPVALKLPLDVTSPESIQKAVEQTVREQGRIDVLVNNAGYALRGAVEEVPIEQVRQMFDANVFGVMRMIQAVVPQMRGQKAGRIINISTIAGRMVFPGNGSYSSTKYALEAISDALRLELEPYGIQVILVEPGAIKTSFEQTVHTRAEFILTNPESPYRALYRQYQQVSDEMRRQESGPEVVSKVIQQVIESSKPKNRYLVGVAISGRLVNSLRDIAGDSVVRHMFKIRARG
ncbi:MAG: SDR family oxidoreductase [Anaerolineales bacterium]|jgi:NAD(P)-dependent dehydrogenase (short-subunit alcohol dehydrogenase family)